MGRVIHYAKQTRSRAIHVKDRRNMIQIPRRNDRNPPSNTPLGKNISPQTRLFARFVSSKPEEIGGSRIEGHTLILENRREKISGPFPHNA